MQYDNFQKYVYIYISIKIDMCIYIIELLRWELSHHPNPNTKVHVSIMLAMLAGKSEAISEDSCTVHTTYFIQQSPRKHVPLSYILYPKS